MKAYEHYQESTLYAANAADNENFEAAILQGILAVAEALQALVMLKALDEIQHPTDRAEWRDLWRGSVQRRKCT